MKLNLHKWQTLLVFIFIFGDQIHEPCTYVMWLHKFNSRISNIVSGFNDLCEMPDKNGLSITFKDVYFSAFIVKYFKITNSLASVHVSSLIALIHFRFTI